MKIIGGSFGLSGSAKIRDDQLVISGATDAVYPPDRIVDVSARVEKERKFGLIGAIIAWIILSVLLGFFMGPLAILVALILSIAGSFYSKEHTSAAVTFDDGTSVELASSRRQIKSLIKLKNSAAASAA